MTTHHPGPCGVGIAYHPFLHATILAHPDTFAFVEVPLEAYLDEARRGLLDPDLVRLKAVAATHPVVWRGRAFALGTDRDTTSTEAALARLVAATGAAALHEEPCWPRDSAPGPIGRRAESLRSRMPCRLALDLRLDALASTTPAGLEAVLTDLAAATACDLVLSLDALTAVTADLAAWIGQRLPGRVTGLALAPHGDVAWTAIGDLVAVTGARSVVIRRERQLFPIGEILDAAACARAALEQAGSERSAAPSPDAVAVRPGFARAGHEPAPEDGPRSAVDDEVGFAARAAWRERLADLHRTLQLARWAARPPAWEV